MADKGETILNVLKWVGVVTLIAVMVLALIAAGPKLTEGLVVDKDHDYPWTEIQNVPMTNADGSTYIMTSTVYHPEEWRILVEGYDKDDKFRTEWWATSEAFYPMVTIGDHVRQKPNTHIIYLIEEEDHCETR